MKFMTQRGSCFLGRFIGLLFLCMCLIPVRGQQAPHQGRAVVVLFGIAARGFRHTWQQLNRNIIEQLEAAGYSVDVHMINNNIGDAFVDDLQVKPVNFDAWGLSSVDDYLQSDIDKEIHSHCHDKVRCFAHSERLKRNKVYLNMMRQMWIEQKVADYLIAYGAQYDVAVAMVSEYYPLIPLDVVDINKVPLLTSSVIMSGQADFGGYTNGFYMGKPKLVAKSLSGFLRQDYLYQDLERSSLPYYEKRLKMSMNSQGIDRILSTMSFCKMRASSCCGWPRSNDLLGQTEESLQKIHASAYRLQRFGYVVDPPYHLKGWRLKLYRFTQKHIFSRSRRCSAPSDWNKSHLHYS